MLTWLEGVGTQTIVTEAVMDLRAFHRMITSLTREFLSNSNAAPSRTAKIGWKLAICLAITSSILISARGIFHERISLDFLQAIKTPGRVQYWKDGDSARASNNFPATNQSQTVSPRMQIRSAAKPSILFANPPLSFEANLGQAPAPVQFLANGHGYALSLLPDEAVLNLSSPTLPARGPLPHKTISLPPREKFRVTESKLHLKLAGGNVNAAISASQELSEKSFYFIGNDSQKWQTRIPNYSRVSYRDIYPGVDLIYHGNEGRLEYDFVVAPGVDPKMILLEVQGARRMTLDEQGNLILVTSSGRLELQKPIIYQSIGKERRLVAGNYSRLERNRIGFKVGSYDSNKPLIIDPVLSYTTYVGRSLYDRANGIALGPDGSEFVTGVSPKPGSTTGTSEAFVAHLSADGSQLLYLVYLGGSDTIEARGIAVDAAGNAYITGETYAADFPTLDPLQATCSLDAARKCSGDAFVTKLNPDGSMVYSTYLGGSGEDGANAIAVDTGGNAYIAGATTSTDFPVFKAAQATTGGNGDAFVAKISTDGMHVLYATYLGGTGKDEARVIALDGASNVFITGQTYSRDFPIQNALQRFCHLDALNRCNGEAFVSKLSADGSSLHYSTYLGGSGGDAGNAIAVDATGSVYVAGATLSADFPTLNPIQAAANGRKDAFVAKLSPAGTALEYSTYLGGSGEDEASAIAVAPSGAAVVVGYTFSHDFPVQSAIQASCHKGTNAACSQDAFIAVIDPTGGHLKFSSYLGGTGADEGRGITLDANENVFLAGTTTSTDFPMAKSTTIPNATVRSAADTAPATGLGTAGTIGGAFAAKLSGLPGLGKNSPSQKPQTNSATSCSGSNSWTGTAGNNLWASPTNWSSGSVPVSTDSVCIGASFAGTVITVGSLAAANQIIASLVSNADLSITGGPLAVTGTSNFVNNLFISGGTLALNGAASVGGNTTISAGILGGTGTTTLSGLLTWTGGFICSGVSGASCVVGTNAVVNANAGINFPASANVVISNRTFNNNGTATWSGANGLMTLENGAILNNPATMGVWNYTNDSVLAFAGGNAVAFNNAGNVEKTAGTATTTIGVLFNNSATVNGNSGTMTFSAGGNCGSSCAGTYTAGASGTINFPSGVFTQSGPINGAGTVNFNGATMDFGTGTETISTARVNLIAGILGGASPGILNFATLLNWTGGSICSGVSGASCVVGTNAVVNANAGINFPASANVVISNRTFNNNGTATWSGANGVMTLENGAIVNNPATMGVWNYTNDSVLAFAGGNAVAFNNAGNVEKTAGTATTTIGVLFNNSATVNGNSGTMTFSAGGNCGSSCAGTYTAGASGTINFPSGVFTQSGPINGAGTVNFNGATMDFGTGTETISTAKVNLIAGILGGASPGILNFATLLNWTGGSICSGVSGASCVVGTNAVVNANAGINFPASANVVISNRTFNNNGTATWSGANGVMTLENGAIVNNPATTGVWNYTNDSVLAFAGGNAVAFNNAGNVEKTAGTATTTIGVPFNNTGTVSANSGTLSFSSTFTQTAGSTFVGSATIAGPPNLNYQGGTITGLGTYTGNVLNTGATLAPGVGTTTAALTIATGVGSGNYNQGASASYDVKLGGTTAGTQFDQTNMSGAGTLAGTLNVSLINGFVPASGNSFMIMTMASRSGQFNVTNLPALPNGLTWTVTYNPGSVVLSIGGMATAASIAATSGTPQSATINTAFAAPLVATVKDSGGNPVAGATVTFTAPGSGASGTFAGGVNTATTNASGVATSTTFTANGTAGGPYAVT